MNINDVENPKIREFITHYGFPFSSKYIELFLAEVDKYPNRELTNHEFVKISQLVLDRIKKD